MSIDLLKRSGLFIVFALAQTIVLGRIHLFGYATPLLYVYFVLLFPRNYPNWAILLWSFFLGLTVDVFFNTPGVAAASMTLIGAIQPYFFELFVPRDSSENLKPSVKTLGTLKYFNYSAVLVVLYCLVFFSLEVFNYYNWVEWLKCVVGSAVFTLVLIWTFDSVAGKEG